jgi:DHA1 family bicyclomycin/chloramphenicol resistance-like MFS transporter
VADGPAAQRMLSQTTMMFALAPAIAPVIGGWLHALAGWRAVFIFLSGVALLLALFCWRFLPETLPPEQRQSLRPRAMAQGYAMMASHGPFLRLAAALGFNFVGFFLYVLAAPEFLVRTLGVPTTGFAWLFLPCIAGTMLGAFASSRLAGRLRPIATIRIGYAIMFASVGVNLLLSWLLDPPRVPWVTLPLMGYNIGMALAMAPLQVMLLDMFDQRRGMASRWWRVSWRRSCGTLRRRWHWGRSLHCPAGRRCSPGSCTARAMSLTDRESWAMSRKR